ncbi:MAG: ergothioneine biosynthesis protein EgtB [Bacteriovoracaceae bacterium]
MDLKNMYLAIREETLNLVNGLHVEDMTIQVSPEMSPIKWHLGHTTWFFEELVLKRTMNDKNSKIFNSYYKSLGEHWLQSERGKLSRPRVSEILENRAFVDKMMLDLLESDISAEIKELVILGLNHEQQHQELILMDVKLLFSYQTQNVIYGRSDISSSTGNCEFINFKGGLVEIGLSGATFSYDNEVPRHQHFLYPYKLKSKLETNREYLEFIEAGGYQNPNYWLSDGFNWVKSTNTSAPLYWRFESGKWWQFTLEGEKELDLNAPVSHVSFYEAAAYARFRGKRLPTEFEWEHAASISDNIGDMHLQLWQWTFSDYAPYPRHQWLQGPLGEYNSKFMVNLKVLRGGCFATPVDHYRLSYRNYFAPHMRWMFSGIRLAEDSHE